MALPVPSPTTTDLARAVVEVAHEALNRAEVAEAELAAERERSAKLALDLRSAEDRIARQGREQSDSDRVVKGLREAAGTPLSRAHHGLPVSCWCGMRHGHEQAIALNAPKGRDRIEKNT